MSIIQTIGYEGAELCAFIETLEEAGIEHLIDIRERALSRKPGFSKSSLSKALAAVEIEYTHLRALGDPKAGRDAMRAGKVDEFRKIYALRLSEPAARAALHTVLEIASENRSVLLCFERDPQLCHRKIVADKVAVTGSFQVRHIGVMHSRKVRDEQAPRVGQVG